MKGRRYLRAGLFAVIAPCVLACAAQTVIYEKPSRYNTIIVTEDHNGLRTLLFERGGTRQSVVKPGDPDHLELRYAKVALVGLALCEDPRRILVVGLGGGTLPTFLRKHYPSAAIDVAEIDPDVVDVAKKFFGFREDERMRAHVGDGRRFIENVPQPYYDIIYLDAFDAHNAPEHLTTQEFLQAVRLALVPSGVVVGNVWGASSNRLYDSMVRTYQEAFDELFIVNVSGDVNSILLALPRKQRLGRSELALAARKISTAKQFRFDLGDLVEHGFLHADEKNQDVRVLRDADLRQPR
ncbi:MAG TPA: fused MFS/spermidine synthase [Burkholderiales bacterium]|nr:fused MFS/spermidine synthase [Burkholderiales bacterium]